MVTTCTQQCIMHKTTCTWTHKTRRIHAYTYVHVFMHTHTPCLMVQTHLLYTHPRIYTSAHIHIRVYTHPRTYTSTYIHPLLHPRTCTPPPTPPTCTQESWPTRKQAALTVATLTAVAVSYETTPQGTKRLKHTSALTELVGHKGALMSTLDAVKYDKIAQVQEEGWVGLGVGGAE